jgi:lysophospholipase L1-like esterase
MRVARAIIAACAVLALGTAVEPAPAPSAAARSAAARARYATPQARSARTRYYVALGDSLAQGMQPEAAGITVDTDQGYADQLYAIEHRRIRALKLVKLGCGGETTSSFLSGRGNPDALILGCTPVGGSQMVAAERFLRTHRHHGEVAFLTLDIGANDVVGCVSGAKVDEACVIRGLARANANLPVIMRRLRRAAAPGTPMAAMTLYDPFLELYLLPGDQQEALTIDGYAHIINSTLAHLYRAAKFRVARVDEAFKTYDTTHTTTLAGRPGAVPVAVAEVCRLTWMCAAPPVGPNIHANETGYSVIASTFAHALGRPGG